MDYRTLLVAALLASSAGGLAEFGQAATIATDSGIAVKDSDLATPRRGMTMSQVASKFGAPVSKLPAVGKPPISRWEYPGFVVYFEHEHVIHSVVASSASDAGASSEPSASGDANSAADTTAAAGDATSAAPARGEAAAPSAPAAN